MQHEQKDPTSIERSSIGRLFDGRYLVERVLGSSAVGTTFVARHEALGRDVALRVVDPALASRPDFALRFEREARALAKLRHPNLDSVLDFGIEDSVTYLVTELVEGDLLPAFVATEAPPLELGLELVRQLLRGLAHAHANGVVHLGLRPENIVIRRLSEASVQLVVVDFGMSALLGEDGAGAPLSLEEQKAADVYSLAGLVLELLTGERAEHGGLTEVLHRHPPLGSLAGLDALLEAAQTPQASTRPRDAGAFLEAFENIAGVPRETPTPRSSFATAPTLAHAPITPVPTAPSSAPIRESRTSNETSEAPSGSGGGAFALSLVLLLGAGAIGGAVAWKKGMIDADSLPTTSSLSALFGTEPEPEPRRGGSPLDQGIPDELAELHDRIAAGDRPSRAELQRIARYNTDHGFDARGLLLLGRASTDRRSYSDAVAAYLEACRRDETSAADPRLRADLVRIAGFERSGPDAADAIEECLGVGAISEVDDAAQAASDPETRQRFAQLSTRLRASPHRP